jgi:hypothetical protein
VVVTRHFVSRSVGGSVGALRRSGSVPNAPLHRIEAIPVPGNRYTLTHLAPPYLFWLVLYV